jgi:hypothetical protein
LPEKKFSGVPAFFVFLKNMRNLKYLILHCTATKQGVNVAPQNIIDWHTLPVAKGGRGWSRVGYNKLFLLDGTTHDFYPDNFDDVVQPNEVSYGVWGENTLEAHNWCYVGGLDAIGNPRDTRTKEQLEAMELWVKGFVSVHPDIQIGGHHQFGIYYPDGSLDRVKNNKACPSFWTPDWLEEIGVPEKNILRADPFGYKKVFSKM